MQSLDAITRGWHHYGMFENYLSALVSLHQDSAEPLDWQALLAAPRPTPQHEHEVKALIALRAYEAGLIERALGRDKAERARLESAVQRAQDIDANANCERLAEWEWCREVGEAVLSGDPRVYREVIELAAPFEELASLGLSVSIQSRASWYVEGDVRIRDREIVPSIELGPMINGSSSGCVMPPAKYWATYQAHVCSAAIRVARELFALLPVEIVFAHVTRPGAGVGRGRAEPVPILSAAFERERFVDLYFDQMNPVEAMMSFDHRMVFKRTTGFSRIELLAPNTMTTSA